jgi:prolyl 4-hydroxylase
MIQLYENILPKQFCEYMIAKFEAEEVKDTRHQIFDQIEIVHWKKETHDIIELTKDIAKHYSTVYDPFNSMPKDRKFESIRIKRYEPNRQQSFPLHVDVTDACNCTRYLSFLFYLNDNEAGTKFYFPDEELTFEAKQGNILVFPPMWMFPHEGLMPTENTKYIMSTYFHYV